ncbi:MAG: cytochrome ubiquinol oxidase subunit I [Myxococcaceae bacterium]|jgi:cytochrome d ubiquinol oxidase subunit I|nr:cytochrome ubiquinol oxidase subunit I [Myxococcaceae bacterium]MCA3015658.1 cytochrome ubiquinol oxidase subunit I [Myxococcaceae bacterium]
MDTTALARAQMGLSLAFHIVFAAFGVGLPLLLVVAEALAARTRDERYRLLARRMAKGTAILFAVGAVSGTVLSLELGLLWPELMRRFGEVLGPLFALEGVAFFLEAIFLGVVLYGRERVSSLAFRFSGVVVALSGAASAAFVTVVNAFMNAPVEVQWVDGRAFLEAPWRVFLAPSALTQIVHVLLSCYAVTGFVMAAVHATLLLKGREAAFHRAALDVALPVGAVAALLLPLSGDLSAKQVTKHQPWKLAAMEAHFETKACAPLLIGGLPDEATGTVRFGLEVPCGLSVLGAMNPSAVITGLDQIPPAERPPVTRTHLSFQVMVASGGYLALLSVVALLWRWWRRAWPERRPFLVALVVAGVAAPVAMEAGWLVTEFGRQPYVVRGLLSTAEAATRVEGLLPRLFAFAGVYLFLAATVVSLLLGLFREPEPVVEPQAVPHAA